MSNLFGTMRASLTALQTIQEALSVTQNNVTNASTPGYVRQRLGLRSLEFDPSTGMAGGVASSGMISARHEYSETMVRSEVTLLAEAQETWTTLTSVENAFDLNDGTGIGATLNRLYSAFSSWSVTPNSTAAKENVYAAASDVAASFNRAAEMLDTAAQHNQQQLQTTISDINTLAGHIREYNVSRRGGAIGDAGVDAQLHVDLEKLAELVDYRAIWQEDGTVTVLAGGQAPLVVGDRRFELQVSFYNTDPAPANADALAKAHIIDAAGADVTEHIAGGKLSGLLGFRNETLPRYIGDTQRGGELNRLAKAVTDRINAVLASGYPPPHEPYHLFVYGSSAVSIAHTIRVNPSLAPALLDATDPLTVPPSGNGKALKLAELSNPSHSADMIDGLSFSGHFGKLSADIGRAVSAAKQETHSRTQLAAQARNMRAQLSGISFDEEAVELVQLQRAYQATAKMITTVDDMLELVLSLKR